MLIQLQDADKVWTLLAMVVAQKMIADGERNENVRKTAPQTPRSAKKEREEVLQHERRLPWSPLRSMVEQISTYSLWRTPHQRQGDTQRRMWHYEKHILEQDLWPHGKRSPHRSQIGGRTCEPIGRPMLEQLMYNCSQWEGQMLEKFMENCLSWVGLHTGAKKKNEKSSLWGETMCDELTAAAILCPPCATGGDKVQKNWKLS